MANWPQYPAEVLAGDDPTHSPQKSQNTLLAAQRNSQLAKRIETDASNNLFVRVAASDIGVSPLAVGNQTSIPDNTLTTVVTFTAATARNLSRISAGGSVYAKFQLFFNTVLIETKRTGPGRHLDFRFDTPLVMAPGDVLDLKVTHFYTGDLEDFEGTIYGA